MTKGGYRVTDLSGAARVVHDLGLAANFGGILFGKAAFNPSVGVVSSKTERGSLGGTTWNRFNALNTLSFLATAATWPSARSGLLSKNASPRARALLRAKDALMGAGGSLGLLVLVLQVVLYRQAPGGAVPLETGGIPAAEASARASQLQRAVSSLGSVHVALFAGLIALTTVLSAEAGRTAKPGFLYRAGR
jgi:hypothetical protein